MQVMCGGNLQGVATCMMWGQQFAPLAAATASGPMMGPGGCSCSGFGGGGGIWNAYFPGGGGLGAQAMAGACFCSAPGAGGLISITYG